MRLEMQAYKTKHQDSRLPSFFVPLNFWQSGWDTFSFQCFQDLLCAAENRGASLSLEAKRREPEPKMGPRFT